MNQPTKTDVRAAERLLKKAIYIAIADLRVAATRREPDAFHRVYGKNVERFTTAIHAAEFLLTPKETAAC